MNTHRFTSSVLVSILCGMAATGCVTERVTTSDGRPFPAKPRDVPPPAPGLVPDRMMLVQGQNAEDSDGNGFPDRVHAMCAVFVPGRAVAVAADGDFVLTLWKQGEINRAGSEPIGEWRIEADEIGAYQSRNLVGVCYQFTLDTLEFRDDRTETVFADLRARFEPSGGGEWVYTSDQVRAVRLGR